MTDQHFSEIMDALQAGFTSIEGRLDRVERTIGAWPAPSTVLGLSERVARIEQHLGIRPAA